MGERRCPDLALVGPVGAVRRQVDAELALGRLDRGVDLAGGLRTYTEFVSMTTIVRCPRTGRACSEGACRERHWLSAPVRARPVAQRAAFEANIILRARRLNW